MDYEYEHPNGGWVGVGAPCDAKTFAILNDWPVRSIRGEKTLYPGISLFSVVQTDKGFGEVISDAFELTGKWPRAQTVKIGDKFEPMRALKSIWAKVLVMCPASDPTGMKQPLKTRTHDLYFFPIPEEVFGIKHVFVRIKVPR